MNKMNYLYKVAIVFSFVFILSPFVDAQIPDNAELIDTTPLGTKVYLEPNGIVKWEEKTDGTIIEYYPNGDIKQKITDTEEIFYNLEDGAVVFRKTKEGEKVYNSEGDIDSFIKDDTVTRYREGVPIRKKSLSDDETIFETFGDNKLSIKYKKKNIIVETNEGAVIRFIQPLSFGYELDSSNVGGEIIDAVVKGGEVKKGFGAFFARLFTFKISIDKIQKKYDDEVTKLE